MTFPAPDPTRPITGPFFAPTTAGMLRLPRCERCEHVFWPPSEVCPQCLADSVGWAEQPGLGTVWSTAEYHRAYAPGLADELPYTCVLVELDCGPRLISRLVPPDGRDDVRAAVGDRVRCVHLPAGDGVLPCFTPSA